MKTILLISFGAFVSNMASAHPNLFYLILSVALGIILGAITSVIFIGPTPKPPTVPTPDKRQANVTQMTARKAAKRQSKKANFQIQHGIDIYNYPQGAYA